MIEQEQAQRGPISSGEIRPVEHIQKRRPPLEDIARRAYEISLAPGGGDAERDWYQAESELMDRE
jgi:hypothetical protein